MTVDLSGPIPPQPPSDSSTVLTIGDEKFAVVRREPVDVKCLADETHQLYLVQTETAGAFVVCDACSLSTRVAVE